MNAIRALPSVAFFGLGLMGSGMARRLLIAGYPVTVYNRSSQKAAAFAAAGARVAATPREAAHAADVLISMVADDDASRSLWLGDDGALAGARRGAVCIESSTVSVRWACELAEAAAKRGCDFMDAPVTGSRTQAASGELNFLVGGQPETLQKARGVFEAMGKSITPLGPVGSGTLLKLINNFVCGVQVASLAEALAMIERGGLDSAKALGVLTSGAPGSPLVKAVAARMTGPEETPHFLLRLMSKDLTYAIQEGAKLSLELSTAAAALEVFKRGVAAGQGEKDIAAVIEPLRGSRKRASAAAPA